MNLDKNGKIYNLKNNLNKSKNKKILGINARLGRILIAFLAVFIILIGRLGWLQIVQGAELKESMQRQLTANKTISPKRGTIYDSTGKALAISAQVDTVSIDPTKIVVDNEDDEIAEVMTKQLKEKLASLGYRVELDDSQEKLGYRMRNAQINKIPYTLVIGDKEVNDQSLTYRRYGNEKQINIKVDEFIKLIDKEVKNKELLVDPKAI